MTKRREFPAKIKTDAIRRAAKATGFPCCEMCGVMLKHSRYEFDHRVPCEMGGEPTLENCVVACTSCHSTKTHTQDRPAIYKAQRLERKHMGIKARSAFATNRDGPMKRRMDGTIVKRI